MCLLVSIAGLANATIISINFDDLDAEAAGWIVLPTNYQGFTWTGGWEVEGQAGSQGWLTYNNQYNFPSLKNAAYNDTGAAVSTLSSSMAFSLDSLSVASWGLNNAFQSWSTRTLTIEGYLGATQVYSVPISLGLGFAPITSFAGLSVDKVDFKAASGTWWLVDDISIRQVPEPATLAILGLGGLLLRRKW